MAEAGKVTIRFEAKGDEVLIRTIEKLDAATKALINTQQKAVGNAKKDTSENANHRKAIENLRIKVKALGGEWSKHAQIQKLVKEASKGNRIAMEQLRIVTGNYRRELKKTGEMGLLGVRNNRILGGSFAVLRSKILIGSFAVGLYAKSIGALARLLGEQEKAEKKLSTALGKTSKSLLAYASAQQKLTMFGDEQIINEMSQIAAFTNNEKAIAKLTTAALDLSAAKGIDLASATDLLTKSVFSSTNALSRYGITAEGAVGHTKRLESVTGNIAALYGGQAREQAETFIGSITQLGNSMGDLGERIGSTFSPALHAATKLMVSFTDSLDDEKIKSYGTALITVTGLYGLYTIWAKRAAIATLSFGKALKLTGVGLAIAGLGFAIDKLGVFGDETANLEKELEGLEGELGKLNSKAGTTLALQQKLAMSAIVYANATEQVAALEAKRRIIAEKMNQVREKHGVNEANFARIMKENIEFAIEYNKIMTERVDLEREIGLAEFSQRLQTASIAYGALSETAQMYWSNQQAGWDREMQNLKNDEGFKRKSKKRQEKDIKDLQDKQRGAKETAWKQQKALRMGQVVIDTAAAVMNVWSSVPLFDYGISAGLLSKFVMGMGAFQLGMVANQQMPAFAKGGDFIADRPQPILVGEAGRERVTITPVDRPDSMALGSMGGVNINFSGNVLSQDFIEDEAIPMIKEAIRRGADIGVA